MKTKFLYFFTYLPFLRLLGFFFFYTNPDFHLVLFLFCLRKLFYHFYAIILAINSLNLCRYEKIILFLFLNYMFIGMKFYVDNFFFNFSIFIFLVSTGLHLFLEEFNCHSMFIPLYVIWLFSSGWFWDILLLLPFNNLMIIHYDMAFFMFLRLAFCWVLDSVNFRFCLIWKFFTHFK